ncbi:hypothetical protein C1C97_003695 [Kocuria tytonis]|uniref:Uncharacterized protein n=1 Tax=Kocuria tytonis TaxID=2054280 RepID=A0A495A9K2_9MICC|nr:hypothetical protein C1C97_003695 [Kocuria tytonis]
MGVSTVVLGVVVLAVDLEYDAPPTGHQEQEVHALTLHGRRTRRPGGSQEGVVVQPHLRQESWYIGVYRVSG